MIVRLVKLTFYPAKVSEFVTLFKLIEEGIRSYPGCKKLILYKDVIKDNVFFTYSEWETEKDLNNYRLSVFFKDNWLITKALFSATAEAWSLIPQNS